MCSKQVCRHCLKAGSIVDLHEVGDILAHPLHCLGAAEWAIGRHVNALLVAPFQQSVISPVCMHLNLNTPENVSSQDVGVEYGDKTGRGAMEAASKGRPPWHARQCCEALGVCCYQKSSIEVLHTSE